MHVSYLDTVPHYPVAFRQSQEKGGAIVFLLILN